MFLFLFSAEGRVSKQVFLYHNKSDPDDSNGLEEKKKHKRRWAGKKTTVCPFLLLQKSISYLRSSESSITVIHLPREEKADQQEVTEKMQPFTHSSFIQDITKNMVLLSVLIVKLGLLYSLRATNSHFRSQCLATLAMWHYGLATMVRPPLALNYSSRAKAERLFPFQHFLSVPSERTVKGKLCF